VDHAQERDRAAVLGEDHGAGRIELDRRLLYDLPQLSRGERVKRRQVGEKAGDLAQAGVQRGLLQSRRRFIS
jgi:hypothetical protein